MDFIARYRWLLANSLAAVAAAIMIGSLGLTSKALAFEELDVGQVIDVLTPLFVIALFLERAQEVFVSAWREPRRKEIEVRAGAGKAKDGELDEYKAGTQRIAFLFGFLVALAISTVGVRSLEHLVAVGGIPPASLQLSAFKTLDIVLTGAIIGGGSDGIHKLVSVITDFLDMTRQKIQSS